MILFFHTITNSKKLNTSKTKWYYVAIIRTIIYKHFPAKFLRRKRTLCSTRTRLLFTAQYKNTMQKYYSRKARGQNTVHKQWPVIVHSNSAPDRIMKLLFAFGWQDNSPEVKAIYLPWFQLIFWRIQGSLLLYKASLASVFLRFPKAIQSSGF